MALVDRHVEKNEEGDAVVPDTLRDKALDFFNTIRTVIKQPVYFGILIGRIIDVSVALIGIEILFETKKIKKKKKNGAK